MLRSTASAVLIFLTLNVSPAYAQSFTECGGSREGPSGAIVSPKYPSSYPNNAACSWTITAKPNEIINLKFTSLDLDGYADSCPDVVTIYDGDSSRATPIRQLCRYKEKDELDAIHIRSTGNKMFVTFTSDRINQRPGFFATYWTHVCAPFMYGTNTCDKPCDCKTENTMFCGNQDGKCYCKSGWMSTKCDQDIDECSNPQVERCPFDYKYCVNTDGSFTCNCRPGLVKLGDSCGGSSTCTLGCSHLCGINADLTEQCYCPDTMILIGQTCQACSPMTYGKNCARTCRCNAEHTDVCDSVTGQCRCKTGWTGADCSLDVDECQLTEYVSTCSAAKNLRCVNSLGSYGCACPRGYAMQNPDGNCERRQCDYTINTSPSTVQTTDYPAPYWPNAVCSWLIQAPATSTVSVDFGTTAMQTEARHDTVYFFDGPDTNSKLLGAFSGTRTFREPIRSTTNTMFVRFTSDGSVEYAGFSGTYSQSEYPQNCKYSLTAQANTQQTFGTTTLPRKPKTIQRLFCYWSLSAPSGIISINFRSVSTDPNQKSFVAVYQGTHAGDPLFARYYGTPKPGVIRVPGPNAYVVYQSEEDAPRAGFTAEFNSCPDFQFGPDLCPYQCNCVRAKTLSCDNRSGACRCMAGWKSATCNEDINECLQTPCSLTEECVNTPGSYSCRPKCDQDFEVDEGQIATVQFPSYSLYNAWCKFTIKTTSSKIVTLQIEKGNFQLIERAYCSDDSLDIYDGTVTTANQIGKYCGTRIPSIIRSTSSTMILQLRTVGGSRKGFRGYFYTHGCEQFKFGLRCDKKCTCNEINTQFCDNINGVCVCKSGWTGTDCDEDVDECRTGICPENEECINTPGTYECSCRQGFTRPTPGSKCVGNRLNCVLSTGKSCSHFCTTVNNQVQCICPDGFVIDTSRRPELCVVPLYPNGLGSVDKTTRDIGSVQFNAKVPFGNELVKEAYVHSNGIISFKRPEVPASAAQVTSEMLLEVFWPAFSNPTFMNIYYHLYEKCEPSVFLEDNPTASPDKQKVMDRAAADVIKFQNIADFDVKSVLVVTYEDFVAPAISVRAVKPLPRQTFQAVFVSGNKKERSTDQDFSSEETSYAFYIYPRDKVFDCPTPAVTVGVNAGTFTRPATLESSNCPAEKLAFQVGSVQAIDSAQQCQNYVCKNSRQITNPVYRQEIEQLYKCPCTLDRLGLQWTFYEQRSPDIYCFAISLVAKRRLLESNPRNKLCCYKWNKPADNNNWQLWAQQLAVATFVHNSPDAGHVVAGDPGWYDGVRDNIDAHKQCCSDANKGQLCKRFNLIYPDMECSYDVNFVPGYLLGDPTIVTLDNVTYLMNGWGEYTLMDVSSENFTLQARTDRFQTSKGLSNGTVFTAFAAKDGYGTHFQVELSASKTSMEILAKGFNLTDDFYRQVNYRFSIDSIEVLRDNSGNKTKVVVSFPCGVSFIVRVGIKNLELEMQVLKSLKGKTKGLLGNFNGKTNDEFTLPNGTVLPSNLKESHIFYQFASSYQVTANKSVFLYKKGKKASDYQHPTFVPVFMDTQSASMLKAAVKLCGAGRTACIYDYYITKDSAFAKNSDNSMKQSEAKRSLLANTCPNVTIVKNVNYTNSRWLVREGVVNLLRANGTDANKDALTYLMYENVTGVSINQSGFIFYTPSAKTPVKIGFRVKDAKNCYTPVVNIYTTICPQCRNNGSCNMNEIRDTEYFGGQVQILKCDCPPAYTGENCETELDACLSKPCAKGKTCTDLSAAQQGNSSIGYVCGPCPTGYEEIEQFCFDINECEDNTTCDHICENTEGSFSCSCNEGYVLNRTDSRSCLAKNCSNRCIMQNTWYCDETVSLCVCKDDITTPDCFTIIDHCVSNPCPSNRKCISKGVGFECTCMNGLQPVNGTCSDCGRVLTDSSGSFMSTNYPDNYPSGESCTWTITSNDTNTIILLNFTDYQVEGCPYDYMEIYDGTSFESDIIGQFCISGITEPISSSGNSLFISFISDGSVNQKGFLATYIMESQCRIKQCSHACKIVSASPRIEQCVCPDWTRLDATETKCLEINACNTTVSNNTGIIVSPGYPKKYQVNSSCHWAIPSKPQLSVNLSFSDMDIESGVSCPYDSLKIYNGTSASSPLLGIYCGSSLPRSISSTNSLYLVFTSDGLITGRGFKLQYIYELNQVIPLRPPADVTV